MALTREGFKGDMVEVVLYGVLATVPQGQFDWLSRVHAGYVYPLSVYLENNSEIIANGAVMRVREFIGLRDNQKI